LTPASSEVETDIPARHREAQGAWFPGPNSLNTLSGSSDTGLDVRMICLNSSTADGGTRNCIARSRLVRSRGSTRYEIQRVIKLVRFWIFPR